MIGGGSSSSNVYPLRLTHRGQKHLPSPCYTITPPLPSPARWVPCNYQPANPAKKLAHPSQGSVPAPKGWRWDMDKRPWV